MNKNKETDQYEEDLSQYLPAEAFYDVLPENDRRVVEPALAEPGTSRPIWDEDGYISVRNFAQFGAYGESTVRRKFHEGRLKGKQLGGGSIRILKSELRPNQ